MTTSCHVVNFVFTPPSKFKIYNMTIILKYEVQKKNIPKKAAYDISLIIRSLGSHPGYIP